MESRIERYPVSRRIIACIAVVLAVIFALPNAYAPDPAVQVRWVGGDADTARLLAQVEVAVAGLPTKSIEEQPRTVLVRFHTVDEQVAGLEAISKRLRSSVVAATNLASAAPPWLEALGARALTLGLDLRGGIHFLLEVDFEELLTANVRSAETGLREIAAPLGAKVRTDSTDPSRILVEGTPDQLSEFQDEASNQLVELQQVADGNSDRLVYELAESFADQLINDGVKQNIQTLRKRVNELGVAEPIVQRQGKLRIAVQLPGVQDTAQAKDIIGRTASLEFRLEAEASRRRLAERFESPYRPGTFELLDRRVIVRGDNIIRANASADTQTGQAVVRISLDSVGGRRMGETTSKHLGKRMGVVLIEQQVTLVETGDPNQEFRRVRSTQRDLISFPTINGVFGSSFQIEGLDSMRQASELALLLRSGSLAAPMTIVEETTIGPNLGWENITAGIRALAVGMVLVVLFMLWVFSAFGAVATFALTVNLVCLVAILSTLGATLTLPGIAGMVLTLGMAVDANVLIFMRVREELRKRVPVRKALARGYERAFETIMDANLTTLIAAVTLFAVGTGPVRGFATTLAIGIVTSIFSAVTVTRVIIDLGMGDRKVKKVWI